MNELERMWKEAPWPNLMYYTGIWLEGPRKITESHRIVTIPLGPTCSVTEIRELQFNNVIFLKDW
jgi:hypothetical protein